MAAAVLTVQDLRAYFHTRRGIVRAVDGVSFDLAAGETLGIVGESGSGKSVTQLSMLRLLPSPPLKIESGVARFLGGDNLLTLPLEEMRKIRGGGISMIFQEPMTSLNPYLKVGAQVIEPLLVHFRMSKKEAWAKGLTAMNQVGIGDPERIMKGYPHELSGGMRQRVMIAMALTTDPKVLIADEPTTALDVTVQAQILELLKKVQNKTGMSLIFISHDLGVIAGVADRVFVMYAGRMMETGSASNVFKHTQHPYTDALLKATPRLDRVDAHLPAIRGNPPDLAALPPGCPFSGRCDHQLPVCVEVFPAARSLGPSHSVHCHWERQS